VIPRAHRGGEPRRGSGPGRAESNALEIALPTLVLALALAATAAASADVDHRAGSSIEAHVCPAGQPAGSVTWLEGVAGLDGGETEHAVPVCTDRPGPGHAEAAQ